MIQQGLALPGSRTWSVHSNNSIWPLLQAVLAKIQFTNRSELLGVIRLDYMKLPMHDHFDLEKWLFHLV